MLFSGESGAYPSGALFTKYPQILDWAKTRQGQSLKPLWLLRQKQRKKFYDLYDLYILYILYINILNIAYSQCYKTFFIETKLA
jgi:hypothetical protein